MPWAFAAFRITAIIALGAELCAQAPSAFSEAEQLHIARVFAALSSNRIGTNYFALRLSEGIAKKADHALILSALEQSAAYAQTLMREAFPALPFSLTAEERDRYMALFLDAQGTVLSPETIRHLAASGNLKNPKEDFYEIARFLLYAETAQTNDHALNLRIAEAMVRRGFTRRDADDLRRIAAAAVSRFESQRARRADIFTAILHAIEDGYRGFRIQSRLELEFPARAGVRKP